MTAPAESCDVAIVGASTAGCTAARLLGQQGLRVALVERRPAMDAHKTVCTHYIQSSATPTIERLGLAPRIEARGAVRNSIDLWTTASGWIETPGDGPFGYNVTRRTLDPILRELAASTPGVELIRGWTAVGLFGGDCPEGVEIEDRSRQRRRIAARVVVGADGRGSAVARWAGVPGRVKPNARFFYWAYWRGVRPDGPRSKMWLLERDCAYTFPNEDGLTVVLVAPHRDRLPEFRADPESAYLRTVRSLPDAPDLSGATRESKLIGKLDLPNVMRPAAAPGVAFAGDAALASDPLWGVGCGWAFQSGEWLAETVGPALGGDGDPDAALERYRRLHGRRLAAHHFLITDYSSGRPATGFERRLWRRAAEDPVVLRAFEGIGSRREPPSRLLRPSVIARLL